MSEKLSAPVRVQLSRKKGWKMPPNTVSVARPTKWGNPFTPFGCADAGYIGTADELRERCAGAFRVWLATPYWRNNWDGAESAAARAKMLDELPELRGKNLACWCPLDKHCHADVLLELSNADALLAERQKGGDA